MLLEGECGGLGRTAAAQRDELQSLITDYPKRWHVEESFNAHQDLGSNRAGTLNLHPASRGTTAK